MPPVPEQPTAVAMMMMLMPLLLDAICKGCNDDVWIYYDGILWQNVMFLCIYSEMK